MTNPYRQAVPRDPEEPAVDTTAGPYLSSKTLDTGPIAPIFDGCNDTYTSSEARANKDKHLEMLVELMTPENESGGET